jgi:hypothetical protein
LRYYHRHNRNIEAEENVHGVIHMEITGKYDTKIWRNSIRVLRGEKNTDSTSLDVCTQNVMHGCLLLFLLHERIVLQIGIFTEANKSKLEGHQLGN